MSTTLQFGTIKRVGAVLIAVAIVLAAGTVVGQAPAIFGADVTDDPEASITFEDQTGDGTSVTIESVSLSEGGFVAVTDGTEVVGVSEYLEPGSYEEVTVDQRSEDDLEMLGELTATVHHDTTENETFVHESDVDEGEDHDLPYVDDGYPVSDSATVTMTEGSVDDTTTSLAVESVDAPERATVNDSLEVTATVHNPDDAEVREHVDFRLSGVLLERQIAEFEANETRELTFSIDLDGTDPGEHTYGVYTAHDGYLGEVYVEYDGPASVSVLEAQPDHVAADVTLPTQGFLAVEDEDNTTLGTSEQLEAGAHENVSISLEEGVEDNDSVTVVAYEGHPDDLERADEDETDDGEVTAFTEDGERVAVTVTIGEELEAAADDDSEGEGSDEETDDEAGEDDSDDGDEDDGDGDSSD